MASLNKVYNILGWKMRLNWLQPHHGYWGLMGMAWSSYGAISALDMASYGYVNQMALECYSGALILVVQVLAFLIHTYIMLDDFYDQHHRQVWEPSYHSPVHNWYVGYFYVSNSWIARAIRKLNEWADGR